MHGFPRCHQSIDLWHGMARGIYVCHAQEGLGTAEWNIVFCTFPFGLLILAREWKISVELETIGPKHELEAPCFFHKQGNCRNGNKYPYLYDPIPATLNIKATPVTHKTQLTQTILQQKQKPSQAQQKLSQKKNKEIASNPTSAKNTLIQNTTRHALWWKSKIKGRREITRGDQIPNKTQK